MEPFVVSMIGIFLSAIGSFILAITEVHRRKLAAVIFIGALISILGSHLQEKESENLITGGDSYCYVTVQAGDGGEGWMTNPVVWCKGKNPAYDVSVRLYDPDAFTENMSQEEFLSKGFDLDVGTVWPNGFKPFGGTRTINFVENDRKILKAHITTRNNFFIEELILKKINNHWLRAVKLYKARAGGLKGEFLYDWADQDFPRDSNGQILWVD